MLPPATEKVWNFLREQTALNEFVLIGGSALALRIGHRVSEDLDLAFCGAVLPRERIEGLLATARGAGVDFIRDDDPAALTEFANGGLELHDYQQNFLVHGEVKVSLFVPDPFALKVIETGKSDRLRIASVEEIFRLKCLVSAVRSKTRDWLDLFLLMRDHGFTARDFHAAFEWAGNPGQRDIALTRLCSGVPQKDDEGYAHLIADAPSLAEMTKFFLARRDEIETQQAAEAKRARDERKR